MEVVELQRLFGHGGEAVKGYGELKVIGLHLGLVEDLHD